MQSLSSSVSSLAMLSNTKQTLKGKVKGNGKGKNTAVTISTPSKDPIEVIGEVVKKEEELEKAQATAAKNNVTTTEITSTRMVEMLTKAMQFSVVPAVQPLLEVVCKRRLVYMVVCKSLVDACAAKGVVRLVPLTWVRQHRTIFGESSIAMQPLDECDALVGIMCTINLQGVGNTSEIGILSRLDIMSQSQRKVEGTTGYMATGLSWTYDKFTALGESLESVIKATTAEYQSLAMLLTRAVVPLRAMQMKSVHDMTTPLPKMETVAQAGQLTRFVANGMDVTAVFNNIYNALLLHLSVKGMQLELSGQAGSEHVYRELSIIGTLLSNYLDRLVKQGDISSYYDYANLCVKERSTLDADFETVPVVSSDTPNNNTNVVVVEDEKESTSKQEEEEEDESSSSSSSSSDKDIRAKEELIRVGSKQMETIQNNIHNFLKIKLNNREVAAEEMTACMHCGAYAAVSKCAKCKQAHYCNKECQTKNWKSIHKLLCPLQQYASGMTNQPATIDDGMEKLKKAVANRATKKETISTTKEEAI